MSKFSLLLILIFFASCQNEKPSQSGINLFGNVSGVEADTLFLVTDSRFKYHNQPQVERKIIVGKDGNFSDTINIKQGHYKLYLGEKEVSLWLSPPSEVQVNVRDGNMSFEGEGKKENIYLQERDSVIAEVGGRNFYQYFSKLPEDEFLQHANELEKQRLELISRHPDIDRNLEKTEILWAKVEKAHKLHNYSFTRVREDSTYLMSSSYPDPLAELDLNDEDHLHVSLFPILLYSHFGQTSTKRSQEEWEYILEDSFPMKNTVLRENVLYTTALFSMNRFQKLDEFYKEAQIFLKNEDYKKEITEKYMDIKNLSPGKPAPLFSLKNMTDENVALEEMKGNLVYLDFWSTSCKPCIEDMPEFRELQNNFRNEKVKFVSIAITSPKERVQYYLEKNQMLGINLYDPLREEQLKKEYAITAIPRYILIDKEGKIIEHMAKTPSDPELATQLKNYLK